MSNSYVGCFLQQEGRGYVVYWLQIFYCWIFNLKFLYVICLKLYILTHRARCTCCYLHSSIYSGLIWLSTTNGTPILFVSEAGKHVWNHTLVIWDNTQWQAVRADSFEDTWVLWIRGKVIDFPGILIGSCIRILSDYSLLIRIRLPIPIQF